MPLSEARCGNERASLGREGERAFVFLSRQKELWTWRGPQFKSSRGTNSANFPKQGV